MKNEALGKQGHILYPCFKSSSVKMTSLREIYQIILNKPTESDFISIIVLLDLRRGPCRGHFLYGLLQSTTKFHLYL